MSLIPPLRTSLTSAAVAVFACGAVLAGCSGGSGPSSAPPSVASTVGSASSPGTGPADSPSPAASSAGAASPTPEALVITVDGAGPYQLGTKLSQLEDAGLLTDPKTGGEICTDYWSAGGVGRWQPLQLWFRPDGTLDLVIVRDPKITTPSGAKVGMTLDQLKSQYGSRGEVLTNGAAKAYIVIVGSGRSLFFDLDLADKKVVTVIAGDGARLKPRFLSGSDC